MCLRCLFGAPMQVTYTPSSGYRVWIPDMPAAGIGPTIDTAFWAVLGPRLRSQIGEPVPARQIERAAHDSP